MVSIHMLLYYSELFSTKHLGLFSIVNNRSVTLLD